MFRDDDDYGDTDTTKKKKQLKTIIDYSFISVLMNMQPDYNFHNSRNGININYMHLLLHIAIIITMILMIFPNSTHERAQALRNRTQTE